MFNDSTSEVENSKDSHCPGEEITSLKWMILHYEIISTSSRFDHQYNDYCTNYIDLFP